MTQILSISNSPLIKDLRLLIDQAKHIVARTANCEMTKLYWNIGKRIREEIIGSERAEYGEQIVKNLAKALTNEYGKGFSKVN